MEGQTDRDGVFLTRGFLGSYKVNARAGRRSAAAEVQLPKAGRKVRLTRQPTQQ